jgi:hypothetical protein
MGVMENDTTSISYFNCLSVEIQLYIFSFLNVKDLAITEAVSKNFQVLSKEGILWKPLAIRAGATLTESYNAKNFVKKVTLATQLISKLFSDIPLHSHHIEQMNANLDYLYINNTNLLQLDRILNIQEVLSIAIKNGEKTKIKALFVYAVKPTCEDLKIATEKKCLKIVKLILNELNDKNSLNLLKAKERKKFSLLEFWENYLIPTDSLKIMNDAFNLIGKNAFN